MILHIQRLSTFLHSFKRNFVVVTQCLPLQRKKFHMRYIFHQAHNNNMQDIIKSFKLFRKENFPARCSSQPNVLYMSDDKKKFREPYRDYREGDSQSYGSNFDHMPQFLQQNSRKRDENDEHPDRNNKFGIFTMIALGVIGFTLISRNINSTKNEISQRKFFNSVLPSGEVYSIVVDSSNKTVYVYTSPMGVNPSKNRPKTPIPIASYHHRISVTNIRHFEEELEKVQQDMGIPKEEIIPVTYLEKVDPDRLSSYALFVVAGLIIGLIIYSRRNNSSTGNIFGENPFRSQTRAKAAVIFPGGGKDVRFKDVAGMMEAKQEVSEFVDYLKQPIKYEELGAKIPKGALLCGPPGTGKTLLAKAIATEASVPFLSMSGSDFVEIYSGVGSARVRDLFKQAKQHEPCIVYIDEVDAIGRSRSSSTQFGGNSEQENTLNQLLVEMDGINTVESVVMFASTNRPDILDKALMRPGRFDRMITIDLPVLQEREDIFQLYLKELKLGFSCNTYAKQLAELTPGKSGADIKNICNEAALHAARFNKKLVDSKNFEYAIERVMAGIQKKSSSLSDEERTTVAYHEAGHAVVSWMLEFTDPVLKISIIPRTSGSLGYTQSFPSELKLHTNEQLFDKMCVLLGGRVSESMIFNKITTGAENDLRQVTTLAYEQIVKFGMNDKIGPISFPVKKSADLSKKPYSDKLAREIDRQASLLIGEALQKAQSVLEEHKEKLIDLAETLKTKEILQYEELVALLGPEPHESKRQRTTGSVSSK